MTVTTASDKTDTKATQRRAMGVAGGAHALFDGYTDLIFIMLPIWQAEFGLSYAQVGIIRGMFSGTMAGFQIPATKLAEKTGTRAILAAAAALCGGAYFLVGASAGFITLLAALFIGGLAASVQHPVASNLVASAYGARARTAIGTYNFAGDLGKMAIPALTSLLLVVLAWRYTVSLMGALGIVAAVLIFMFTPAVRDVHKTEEKVSKAAPSSNSGFWFLLSIGVLDSATRMAFLTFLPFLLKMKGASLPEIGLALMLVFAGGALGKLGCAFLGSRLGTIGTVLITEGFTALGIVALLPLPLWGAFVLLPFIGFALNGTSSVLYGSVPDLVPAKKRPRAFGIFYTGTIGAGALSPVLYGLIGDQFGINQTLIVVACAVLLTIPLALFLRPAFRDERTA
ncbi:MAG TPA: MFS transporter [Xanthobacteraceae bacterium]|nr:MFS transporter [Xanthobacteraceae bacterium]